MCELLGLSARRTVRANDALRKFYSHADQHPHGWGLARFPPPGGAPFIEKEAVKATASDALRRRLAAPVEARTLIAHIRLATVGDLAYANCHPFAAADAAGRVWTLAHNGTIFRGEELNTYAGRQRGRTDSERILLHLVDRVNARQAQLGRPLDATERFDALEETVAALAGGNKLNLLVHDGDTLYAHTNFRDSLHVRDGSGEVWISTRPLSFEGWRPLPFTRLVAFRDGEAVREGRPHGREYIYNPEDYRFLYADYAGL